MDDNFERVASIGDIAENDKKLVTVGGKPLLLCRSDGQYFAIENRCTHDHEQLVGGNIRKCSIVCPFHGARYSLKTGRPFGPPAFEPIATYPVRIVGSEVEVGATPNPI